MVDARIGPGIKSMTKFKKRKEEQQQQQNPSEFAGHANVNAQNIRNNSVSERLSKIFKKKKRIVKSPSKSTVDLALHDESSQPTSPMSSQSESFDENRSSDGESVSQFAKRLSSDGLQSVHRIHGPSKNRRAKLNSTAPFATADQWTAVQSCHGFSLEHKYVTAAVIDVACEQVQVIVTVQPSRVEVPLPMEVDVPVKIPTPTFNKSLPPKKQFRQCMIDAAAMAETVMQLTPIDYSVTAASDTPQDLSTKSSASTNDSDGSRFLHKTRSDTGKVTKKSSARLTPKKKLTDISMVKNLVKLCTDKTASNKKLGAMVTGAITPMPTGQATPVEPANGNENIAAVANKYSDNSSDSGYDETLQDSILAGKGHMQRHSVILTNGIKVQVKPETIVYTTKVVGVSPSVIQSAPVSGQFYVYAFFSTHQKLSSFHSNCSDFFNAIISVFFSQTDHRWTAITLSVH